VAFIWLDHRTKYYANYDPEYFPDIEFIPANLPDGSEFLSKHSQVYFDPGCANLGFAVAREDIREEVLDKLKISRYPPAPAAISALLSTSPNTKEKAKELLQNNSFIPVQEAGSEKWIMVKPNECYLSQERDSRSFHCKMFTFIDFGARANYFLAICGVRNLPTIDDIARMLIKKPQQFLEVSGGPSEFKQELKKIAVHSHEISDETKSLMAKAPILISEKKVARSTGSSQGPEGSTMSYNLLPPDHILIVDHPNMYDQFCDIIDPAPQEDILE
ncbi:4180_t:CDS:2, partial [Acaulospora colombiana]